MLNLDTQKESEQPILKFLEVLLSNKKNPEEKKKTLLDDYGIATTSQMDMDMSDMCNLSRGIAEESHTKGMAEGMERGVTMGEDKQTLKAHQSSVEE